MLNNYHLHIIEITKKKIVDGNVYYRRNLPQEMQVGCERGIYAAVLYNTLQDDAAHNAATTTVNPSYKAQFYGPSAHDQPGKNSFF